jgi:putative spermidine/putrescine transport system substrate-binding protein
MLMAASALLAALMCAGCGPAQDDSNTLVIMVGGGEWADANIHAYVAPFERETGIRVITVRDDLQLSRLKLMQESGHIDIDVGSLGAVQAMQADHLGYLTSIDYSGFPAAQIEQLPAEARQRWGVGALVYAIVIGFDTRSAGERPATWADVWDMHRFPGARSFINGRTGTAPLEEALLADGVPAAELYPLDLDRAFASLDRIKPLVLKWWSAGSEGEQLFRDGQVRVGELYDARLAVLQAAGKPIGFTYEQGKRLMDYWVIPKGAPNAAVAQKFIAFATRAERQAHFAQRIPYGPTNTAAFNLIPTEIGARLASHPDNQRRQFTLNAAWYAAVQADGRTNLDHVIERWNDWISR